MTRPGTETEERRTHYIPVLFGGPGHGTPVPESSDRYVYVVSTRPLAGLPADEVRYVEHKWAPPLATQALRFMAWDQLPEGEAFALAWDWVLDKALGETVTG